MVVEELQIWKNILGNLALPVADSLSELRVVITERSNLVKGR